MKHFKFEPRGKRRIHAKPNMGEVKVCRWWLEQERELIKPKLIVALGATAAASVLGKSVTIRDTRSKLIDLPDGSTKLLVTVHPAYILRLPDPDPSARTRAFHADMDRAKPTCRRSRWGEGWAWMAGLPPRTPLGKEFPNPSFRL